MALADPKYENLPGIAYDQPDVYETGDLPEADQPDPYEEEENECIETLSLSVKDSFNKFRGKFLTGNVDFSDRIGRKLRTGYKAGEWSLAAEGEPETTVERYNRLRCEFSELLEQVTDQQNKSADTEKEEYARLAAQINTTKRLLEELKLDEGEVIDPKAQKLQEHLSSVKRGGAGGGAGGAAGGAGGGLVTAHLRLKPDAALAHTTRVAQLEHRLHRLEQAAGVRDEEAFRRLQAATGEATLCGAAATLCAQAALLRGGDVAAADARVTSLLGNVELMRQARGHAPEVEAKVNELHKMLKQVEGISHEEIIERMEALESLHIQASKFSRSLSDLEGLQASLATGVANNKQLLQGIQEVFAHNVDSLQMEIKKLDERVGKLQA